MREDFAARSFLEVFSVCCLSSPPPLLFHVASFQEPPLLGEGMVNCPWVAPFSWRYFWISSPSGFHPNWPGRDTFFFFCGLHFLEENLPSKVWSSDRKLRLSRLLRLLRLSKSQLVELQLVHLIWPAIRERLQERNLGPLFPALVAQLSNPRFSVGFRAWCMACGLLPFPLVFHWLKAGKEGTFYLLDIIVSPFSCQGSLEGCPSQVHIVLSLSRSKLQERPESAVLLWEVLIVCVRGHSFGLSIPG